MFQPTVDKPGWQPLMSEFQKALGCRPAAPMVRQNACRVW